MANIIVIKNQLSPMELSLGLLKEAELHHYYKHLFVVVSLSDVSTQHFNSVSIAIPFNIL